MLSGYIIIITNHSINDTKIIIDALMDSLSGLINKLGMVYCIFRGLTYFNFQITLYFLSNILSMIIQRSIFCKLLSVDTTKALLI